MSPVVLTLVFATAIGFFMIQPANQLAGWMVETYPKLEKQQNSLAVGLTIVLALTAGAMLAYL